MGVRPLLTSPLTPMTGLTGLRSSSEATATATAAPSDLPSGTVSLILTLKDRCCAMDQASGRAATTSRRPAHQRLYSAWKWQRTASTAASALSSAVASPWPRPLTNRVSEPGPRLLTTTLTVSGVGTPSANARPTGMDFTFSARTQTSNDKFEGGCEAEAAQNGVCDHACGFRTYQGWWAAAAARGAGSEGGDEWRRRSQAGGRGRWPATKTRTTTMINVSS